MSDNYQAVYDAIRSRFYGCDAGQAVESAVRDAFSGVHHQVACAAQEFQNAGYEQQRPCVLFRPKVSIDGNQWCALYGDNLQDGVAGFGDSPSEAMTDFDKNWHAKLQGAAS